MTVIFSNFKNFHMSFSLSPHCLAFYYIFWTFLALLLLALVLHSILEF